MGSSMTIERPRAPQAVRISGAPLPTPEPFEAEYGPIRDEMLAYIDANTDQDELAKGMVGQRFEW